MPTNFGCEGIRQVRIHRRTEGAGGTVLQPPPPLGRFVKDLQKVGFGHAPAYKKVQVMYGGSNLFWKEWTIQCGHSASHWVTWKSYWSLRGSSSCNSSRIVVDPNQASFNTTLLQPPSLSGDDNAGKKKMIWRERKYEIKQTWGRLRTMKQLWRT